MVQGRKIGKPIDQSKRDKCCANCLNLRDDLICHSINGFIINIGLQFHRLTKESCYDLGGACDSFR